MNPLQILKSGLNAFQKQTGGTSPAAQQLGLKGMGDAVQEQLGDQVKNRRKRLQPGRGFPGAFGDAAVGGAANDLNMR